MEKGGALDILYGTANQLMFPLQQSQEHIKYVATPLTASLDPSTSFATTAVGAAVALSCNNYPILFYYSFLFYL